MTLIIPDQPKYLNKDSYKEYILMIEAVNNYVVVNRKEMICYSANGGMNEDNRFIREAILFDALRFDNKGYEIQLTMYGVKLEANCPRNKHKGFISSEDRWAVNREDDILREINNGNIDKLKTLTVKEIIAKQDKESPARQIQFDFIDKTLAEHTYKSALLNHFYGIDQYLISAPAKQIKLNDVPSFEQPEIEIDLTEVTWMELSLEYGPGDREEWRTSLRNKVEIHLGHALKHGLDLQMKAVVSMCLPGNVTFRNIKETHLSKKAEQKAVSNKIDINDPEAIRPYYDLVEINDKLYPTYFYPKLKHWPNYDLKTMKLEELIGEICINIDFAEECTTITDGKGKAWLGNNEYHKEIEFHEESE